MEKLKKHKTKIILAIIIAIQLIVYFIVGVQKSYIHIDEGYSLGLLHYDKLDISGNEDFYNQWHNKDYYNDYLTIGKEEANNFKPVYENQKNDVHPPLYYLLLRIAYNCHLEEFSKWPGIIINMIFISLSTIMLYKIAEKLFKSKEYAILIAFAGGLIISTIESCMLMRMYALNALNILVITYLHLKIWNDEKLKIKDLSLIGICAVLGSLTHYYYLVFLFALYMIFMIRYIARKQYKNAISYTVTMIVAAVVSLLIFPYSFVHIFMGYRGQGAFSNIGKIDKVIQGLGGYLGLVHLDVFNGILSFIVLFMIGLLVYRLIKNREITFKSKNSLLWVVAIPTILYFTIIAIVSPYIEIRYIMPICPLIFLLGMYLIKTVLNTIMENELQVKIGVLAVIIVILVAPLYKKRNITYVYNDLKDIVSKMEGEYNLPTIYLFNKEQNRFMDDIYLFSKINESYILDSKEMSEDKIKEILNGKNTEKGIVVFINGGQENDKELEKIKDAMNFNQVDYLKRMNACDIYYVHNK